MNKHIRYLELARKTLQTEQDALKTLQEGLDGRFCQAVDAILATKGRLVITGIGKSGHVARKMAATLASTGTPSFFVHPAEAAHGDLGMLMTGDTLIAISNSGNSDELQLLIPAILAKSIPLISISKDANGPLPNKADIALTLGEIEEACPLHLAPTSSTTATMALGDALAVVLMDARAFGADDFARSHPAGALGKRLLLKMADVMHTHLPIVAPCDTLKSALLVMTRGRLGMTLVMEGDVLQGIFTDGDLRRYLKMHTDLDALMGTIMTTNPKCIAQDAKAACALKHMQTKKVNQLVVTDKAGRVCGIVTLQDLIMIGV